MFFSFQLVQWQQWATQATVVACLGLVGFMGRLMLEWRHSGHMEQLLTSGQHGARMANFAHDVESRWR